MTTSRRKRFLHVSVPFSLSIISTTEQDEDWRFNKAGRNNAPVTTR